MKLLVSALMVVAALGQCSPPGTNRSGETLGGPVPSDARRQQELCERNGGRWGQGGRSGFSVCHVTPRDAGKSCTRSTDCEGQCLAKSNTCAPTAPLFGCHSTLDALGRTQEICID